MLPSLPSHLFHPAPLHSDSELPRIPVATTEQQDLFPLIERAVEVSEFVAHVAQQDRDGLSATLQQHFQQDDAQWSEQLLSELGDAKCGIEQQDLVANNQDRWLCLDEATVMSRLRQFRRLQSAALAVLNLTNWISLPQAAFRMSLLADYLIAQAYRWSYHQLAQRHGAPQTQSGKPDNLLILGMGKLGGYELNFSSDIDLIFFYPQKGETAPLAINSATDNIRTIENFRFWQRCGSQIIKLLDTQTGEGFVFRTDMRLRPYGESGPLVMSLAEAEDYYQEQGRDWERFAMVRARIITGRQSEQQALTGIIQPFAFRRYIDYGVLDSIRNMKAMIEREVRARGLKDNIKLGAGGIREIEFIVQSMQLIQGGRDKSLQEKNLLAVLPRLVQARMLNESTATELAMAWRWLRKLEDVIQALAEKQTQQLPVDPPSLHKVASVFALDGPQLKQKVEAICQRVRWHFSQLLKQDKEVEPQSEWAHALWESTIQLTQLRPHITADDPVLEQAIELIELFRKEKRILSLSARGRKRLNQFMPGLLSQWAAIAPELETLRRLLSIISAVVRRTAYLELLSENPPLLEHLVSLVARSEWIAIRLANYPILLDELLYPSSLYQPLHREELKDELRQSLMRVDNDEESQMNGLRQFKQINELRIAAAFLTERIGIIQVSRCLSDLAELLLEQVLHICWQDIRGRYGLPESAANADQHSVKGFAILGYGKLGGAELGFGSDLDLVFVFEARPGEKTQGEKSVEAARFYTRLGQKVIHYLSTRTHLGDLFEVDMRLRPSGNSGLLVSNFDAFAEYQKNEAWTWEHQALVRARVVAGDPELARKIDLLRWQILSQPRDIATLRNDVIVMRQKMREQLWNREITDYKQMPGGIVDIEFMAQYLALAFSNRLSECETKDAPPYMPTNTRAILKIMQDISQLTKDDVDLLAEAYCELCQLANWSLLTRVPASERDQPKKSVGAERCQQVSAIWQKLFKPLTEQAGGYYERS